MCCYLLLKNDIPSNVSNQKNNATFTLKTFWDHHFCFSVKKAIFGAFLLFFRRDPSRNAWWCESLSRRRNTLEMAFLTKQSKDYSVLRIKVALFFFDLTHLKGWHFSAVDGATFSTFISKSIFRVNSVWFNSIQTTFKVPGGICW